jgi:hypothetical protein
MKWTVSSKSLDLVRNVLVKFQLSVILAWDFFLLTYETEWKFNEDLKIQVRLDTR